MKLLEKAGNTFDTDYSRQDAAILNTQRACEAGIDSGQYLIQKLQQRVGA